jgi:uncharacterized protein (DUF342 family)
MSLKQFINEFVNNESNIYEYNRNDKSNLKKRLHTSLINFIYRRETKYNNYINSLKRKYKSLEKEYEIVSSNDSQFKKKKIVDKKDISTDSSSDESSSDDSSSDEYEDTKSFVSSLNRRLFINIMIDTIMICYFVIVIMYLYYSIKKKHILLLEG